MSDDCSRFKSINDWMRCTAVEIQKNEDRRCCVTAKV